MKHTHASPEQRVYQAYWQDGSIDLFAGLATTLMGIAWILDAVALGPIAPAICIPLWMVFRRRVIEPRLGRVSFDAGRRKRLRRGHVVLIGAGCATLILGVATYFAFGADLRGTDWHRAAVPGLPGALLGVAGVLSALMFGIPRLALYGLAFVLAGVGTAALDTDPGWALLAGGAITTASGGALLVRFVRHFPALSNELQ